MSTRAQLQSKSVGELREIANAAGIDAEGLQKAKIISALVEAGKAASNGSDPTENIELPAATPRREEDRSGDDGQDSDGDSGGTADRNQDSSDDDGDDS